jgi:hypothetical protein
MRQARLVFLALVFSIAFASAHAANTPLSGIEITVRKIPEGRKIGKIKTDSTGFFKIDHLGPGKYGVEIAPPEPTKKKRYSSAKPTLSSVANPNGIQAVTLDFELFAEKDKQSDFAPVEIEITKNQGDVSGYVTTEISQEPAKKGKAKKKRTAK